MRCWSQFELFESPFAAILRFPAKLGLFGAHVGRNLGVFVPCETVMEPFCLMSIRSLLEPIWGFRNQLGNAGLLESMYEPSGAT